MQPGDNKTAVIRTLADIPKECAKMPHTVLFDREFSVAAADVNSDDLDYAPDADFPGLAFLRHVPYPYRISPAIGRIRPLLRLLGMGRTIICRLSPERPMQLSFALDLIGSAYYDTGSHNRSHIESVYRLMAFRPDDDGFSALPVPIGKSNAEGDSEFLWTCKWDLSTDLVAELIQRYKDTDGCIRKLSSLLGSSKEEAGCLLAQINDTFGKSSCAPNPGPLDKRELEKRAEAVLDFLMQGGPPSLGKIKSRLAAELPCLGNRLRIPSAAMLADPGNSWCGPGGPEPALAILRKSPPEWTTAFSVRLNGEIRIVPDACGLEGAESGQRSSATYSSPAFTQPPHGNAHEPREEAAHKYNIAIVDPGTGPITKDTELQLSVDGIRLDRKVQTGLFVKILVILHCSTDGRCLAFCSKKVYDKLLDAQKAKFRRIMVRNSQDKLEICSALKVFSGEEEKAQELSQVFSRIASGAILGRQKLGGKSQEGKLPEDVFDKGTWSDPDLEMKYSTRRLNVSIEDIPSLEKFLKRADGFIKEFTGDAKFAGNLIISLKKDPAQET